MATLSERLPQNAPGRFYVDSSCIDCDMCRTIAPESFRRDDATGYSYVFRQPITPEEIVQAEEARGCPVDAIGNDGLAEAEPKSPIPG